VDAGNILRYFAWISGMAVESLLSSEIEQRRKLYRQAECSLRRK
jgi:hypothetical protein